MNSTASNTKTNTISNFSIVPDQSICPAINVHSISPLQPNPTQETTVSAKVTDSVNLDDVRLFYTYADNGVEHNTARIQSTALIVDSTTETWNNSDPLSATDYAALEKIC